MFLEKWSALAVLICRVVRQKIEVQGKEVLSVFSSVHS